MKIKALLESVFDFWGSKVTIYKDSSINLKKGGAKWQRHL
jgi:hypothetical protein